jgi:hypothetical protein
MRLLRQLRPAVAAFLAASVLLLGWAATSPLVHAELCPDAHAAFAHDHAHDHGDDAAHSHGTSHDASPSDAPASLAKDHICAVTLFSTGCEVPAHDIGLREPSLNATRVAHFTEFMLARTLRGPARVCGPPALA